MTIPEFYKNQITPMSSESKGQPALGQLNYITYGSGNPVICLHGMAASLNDWTLLGPELAEHGYAAYAPDLLGHGESAKPTEVEQYRLDRFHAHMMAWLENIHISGHPVFIGHSMGGYLALLTALQYPRIVSALVLIDPLFNSTQLSPLVRGVRHLPHLGVRGWQVVPEWLINLLLGWDPISATNFTPETRRQIAFDYKRASPNVVYLATEIPDLSEHVEQIECPTLVIWGTKDLTLAPISFEQLAEKIPHAIRHPIPGSGHQPHIGKPRLVNQIILDFLGTLNSHGADTG